MNEISLILIILISIFSGLGFIFLIIFNVIFLLKRHYLNQDYKLKSKYNDYQNTKIGSNIKSIEGLANKNIKLLPILDYLDNYKNTYEKQLEIVKIQLRSLSQLLRTFKLVEIHKNIKRIIFNFKQLDKQQEEYKKFNLDTQKYSNNVSNIATKLFNIVTLISNFNKENMLNIYYKDNTYLSDINNQIKQISTKINEEQESINSEQAHRLFLNELNLCNQYLNFSKKLYEINQFHISLNAIIDEIKKYYEKSEINNNSSILFYKKISQCKNESNDLIKNITKENIDRKIDIYKQHILNQEEELKKIKLNYSYQELIKENINKFDEYINTFFKIINQHNLKNLCRDILKNFNQDSSIELLALKDIELAKSINEKLNEFNQLKDKNNNNENKNELLINIILNIYKLILEFKNNNELLFELINNKNKDLLFLTFSINDINIKLLELKQLIIDNKINNKEIDEKIIKYRQELDIIQNNLSKNILNNDKEIKNQINVINDFIDDTVILIKNKKEIMQIAKQLKMYANKFKNSSNFNKFKEFENLNKSNKYYDLIESYIEFINSCMKNKKVSS